MEEIVQRNPSGIAIQFIPEVDDITKFVVTGQQVVVKPHVIPVVKSSTGLILSEGIDSEQVRSMMLHKGTVISIGKRCDEIQHGLTVWYYKRAIQGMIRQGHELYYIFNEYDIKAYIQE